MQLYNIYTFPYSNTVYTFYFGIYLSAMNRYSVSPELIHITEGQWITHCHCPWAPQYSKTALRIVNWFNKRCLMGTVRLLAGGKAQSQCPPFILFVYLLSLFLKRRLIQQVMSMCFTSLYWSVVQWGRRKLVKLSV